MKYQELLDEYTELLRVNVHLRSQLQEIPKGYIVTKRISGKDYFYLQYSIQGKKKSEYIHEEDLEHIRSSIALRDPLKLQIENTQKEQVRLESAAKILDTNLYRTFVFLKQCADMDALPVSKRTEALRFAGAMTALEGLPAKRETEMSLEEWAKGHRSFTDIYMKTLHHYRVVEAK